MEHYKNNFGIKETAVRSKKIKNKADLAAMVSVSFLLIVFYMVTINMSKPNILEYGSPEKTCGGEPCCMCFYDDRILTLLLGKNNQIVSYRGSEHIPLELPTKYLYGKNGIRKEIIKQQYNLKQYTGENLIVIIKPAKESNFKNLVDVLDEMAINNVGSYVIDDRYTPTESKMLACIQ